MSVKGPMCLILLGECLRDGCYEDMIDEEQSLKGHMGGGKDGVGRADRVGAEAREWLGGIGREITTQLTSASIVVPDWYHHSGCA